MIYYLTEDNKVQVKYKIVDFNKSNSHYLTDFNKAGLDFALKSKYGEIMIDISEDKAIGYVLVNKAGTIGPIKVYEKYRGHGYSKVLLRDAINKYHGYKLGVMKDNTVAISLYKSFGFKVVKETKDHYNMELEKSIHESEDKSSLSKDYKKGKLNLSDFKLVTIKHREKEGKPVSLTWYNKNTADRIATVLTDTEPASDGYRWFGSLEVFPKYRGYGLADQIIDLVVNKYKAGALAVHKDNEIAIKLYKKHGFEISKTRTSKEYYYMYLKKNQVKTAIKESSSDIDTNDNKELDKLISLYNSISDFKYIIHKNDNGKDITVSSSEFISSHGGMCYDYVNYLASKISSKHSCYFTGIVDKSGYTNHTHTFILTNINDKIYWIECAWKSHKGIYEFDNVSNALSYINNKLSIKGLEMFTVEYRPSNNLIGITVERFIDIMVNKPEVHYKEIKDVKGVKPKKII